MEQLKRYAIFAAVVEAGSMTRAAKALGMTPSAVSQHISQLESLLGLTLLHRSTRRLNLTEAGEVVWQGCQSLQQTLNQTELRLSEVRDSLLGEVRITAPVGMAGQPLARALSPLLQAHPGLCIQIIADDETRDSEQLIANAHSAAELATDPRGCVLFSPMPQAQLRRRLSIESALRGAVERRELQLLYQPRVAIESFDLTGVECLAHWNSPQFGKIRPGDFIGIAEEAGIIDDIGRWMLDETCRQMAAWHERYDRKFFASLRFTGRQLRDPRLAEAVRAAAERHHLPPEVLQVELSEQSLIEAPEAAHEFLDAVRNAGNRIGITDFGTGRSSLGQIRRLPFNSMKLDAALMADLYTDPWTQGVTAAVLSMARATRIQSVADGIDDVATLEMLRALGFDELQGQYVSPPMRALDFEEWLERGGASHLARGYTVEIEREIDEFDSPIDDIMKWANG